MLRTQKKVWGFVGLLVVAPAVAVDAERRLVPSSGAAQSPIHRERRMNPGFVLHAVYLDMQDYSDTVEVPSNPRPEK